MNYIINKNTNPYYNLALEEYCLNNIHLGEDYFVLWQNEPSIIVGKNQNILEEVNPYFVEENNIYVARRITGGGTVYHDLGNLNFSFFSSFKNISKIDFRLFVTSIVETLKILSVDATITNRNDILICGKKISGNAQRIQKNKLLQHGTLLFDTNTENLKNSLKITNSGKIISYGVKSSRSDVTNIKEYISNDINIGKFKQLLQQHLSNNYQSHEIKLTKNDIFNINKLKENKFETWEWTYGESPSFNIENKLSVQGKTINFKANIKNGIFKEIELHSNFFKPIELEKYTNLLKNEKYHIQTIRELLNTLNPDFSFDKIAKNVLISLLFGNIN